MPAMTETLRDDARSTPQASFTTFEESTAEDWQLIASQLPVTQALAGENIITQLEMLARDHGGFPVSRIEHSLQTTARAGTI